MAGKQVQRRRGSTAQHAVFTGALGEITVDTDKKTAVVHDGVTVGGIPLARKSDSDTVAAAAAVADAKAVAAQGTANTGVANAATAQAEVDALEGVVAANFALTVPRDSTTGAATLPGGTTAQRPGAPVEGQIRYNSQLARFEGYQAGAWVVLSFDSTVYQRSNILGAVSQSAGVPTGAIIDAGANAAGAYTRYADGTLICRGDPGGIDQTVANTAYSVTFGLPAAFVGAYSLCVNVTTVNVGNVFSGYSRSASLTASTYQIVQSWSVVQTYTYSYIAIGRWF